MAEEEKLGPAIESLADDSKKQSKSLKKIADPKKNAGDKEREKEALSEEEKKTDL